MEQNVPRSIWESKKRIVQMRCMHEGLCWARPLYQETNTSGICLGDRVLQVRDGMNCGHDEIPDYAMLWPVAFMRKSLSSANWNYSNIECKAHGILNGPGEFHIYCFTSDVYIITNHKPLVAILNKDVMMLLQWLQCIMIQIHCTKCASYISLAQT